MGVVIHVELVFHVLTFINENSYTARSNYPKSWGENCCILLAQCFKHLACNKRSCVWVLSEVSYFWLIWLFQEQILRNKQEWSSTLNYPQLPRSVCMLRVETVKQSSGQGSPFKSNRGLNQVVLHIWSKFGDTSLDGSWVIAQTN